MGQILSWDASGIIKATQIKLERGMERAVQFLEGRVVRSISVGQPVRRSGNSLIGLNPSEEGSPPHVLSGRLRQSITHTVEVSGGAVRGRVGTNIKYARRIELGFVGTDSAGRVIHQGERPYLRPALKNNLREILVRLAKG